MNVKDHTAGLSVPAAATAVLLRNLPLAILYVCLNFTMYYLLELADPDGWDLVFQFVMVVFVFLFTLPVLNLALFSTIMINVSGIRALRAAVAFSFIWRGAVMSLIVGFGVICLWVASAVITALFGNAAGNLYEFNESEWYWFGVTVFEYALDFLLYGLFGTWLAAVVAGGNRKLSLAFARGTLSFERTFAQQVKFAGPVVLIMAACFALAGDMHLETDGSINWLYISGSIAGIACEVVVAAVIAVIISRVYFEVGDADSSSHPA